jgi:NAD(P)-dependent dehydrogenase (short-subunit alcohol dehydrogenase family)
VSRRVALVTGGARRIGAAIVRRLAADGFDVAIHCNGSRDEAEALAAALAPARCTVLVADLADADAMAGLVPATVAALSRIDVLVNSASIFGTDTLQTFETAEWDRHFAVNLRAPALLARDFAAAATHDGATHPCIVNILDQRVFKLTPQSFSYTLTKAALHAATTTMAQALAPTIRVNAVAPGPTLANIHDGEDGMAREAAGILLGETVAPEAIADAVGWLVAARHVTGQTIAVDGGQSIGWRTPDVF